MSEQNQDIVKKEPQGFTGWLAFLGVCLLVKLLYSAGVLSSFYKDIFMPEVWTNIYFLVKIVIIIEMFVNIIWYAGWVFVLILYCSKQKRFVKTFLFMATISIVLIILDSVVCYFVFDMEFFSEGTDKELFSTIFFALVWGAYVLKSKQVANTFVNEGSISFLIKRK